MAKSIHTMSVHTVFLDRIAAILEAGDTIWRPDPRGGLDGPSKPVRVEPIQLPQVQPKETPAPAEPVRSPSKEPVPA